MFGVCILSVWRICFHLFWWHLGPLVEERTALCVFFVLVLHVRNVFFVITVHAVWTIAVYFWWYQITLYTPQIWMTHCSKMKERRFWRFMDVISTKKVMAKLVEGWINRNHLKCRVIELDIFFLELMYIIIDDIRLETF